MSKEPENACPACEYEKNSKGRPILLDGEMQCMDCGSTWRVYGTSIEVVHEAEALRSDEVLHQIETLHLDEVDQAPVAADVDWRAFRENAKYQIKQEQVPASNIGHGKQTLKYAMLSFAVFLLFAGLYSGVQLIQEGEQLVQSDKLHISEVEMDELVRQNGQKVFTVKGRVSNSGLDEKHIPRIAIILRQNNGQEVVRWYHNSALVSLESGKDVRFASAIQYDTPIAAYAEAVFEQ